MTTTIRRVRQRIAHVFRTGGPAYSFEFFPPKTAAAVRALEQAVEELLPLDPAFVSVTYGAGGSTRALTRQTTARLAIKTGLTAMAHLTCVGHSRVEMRAILVALRDAGIVNLMVLRGDPPAGDVAFVPAMDGFRHADELIRFIRAEGFDFCLGAACYPEVHPESASRLEDLHYVRRKVEAGAEFLITQLFFDPVHYSDFVAQARASGITVPIIPGVMPVTNIAQIIGSHGCAVLPSRRGCNWHSTRVPHRLR